MTSTPHDPLTGELAPDAPSPPPRPSATHPWRKAADAAAPRRNKRTPEELAEAERVKAEREARRDRELAVAEALIPLVAYRGQPPSKAEGLRPVDPATAPQEVLRLARTSANGYPGSALVVSRGTSVTLGELVGVSIEYRDFSGARWRTRGVALRMADLRPLAELFASLADEVEGEGGAT
jgi:hypothetical protein